MKELTQAKLKTLFTYDPDTGLFTRKKGKGRPSKVAPNSNGYHMIMIEGQRYYAHRLAFLYMTGEWPEEVIDHDDENRMNNRWKNLIPMSRSANMLKSSKLRNR